MNRLYAMIAAVCLCFAAFMTLALSGRQPEGEGESPEESRPAAPSTGALRAREPGRELRLSIDTEPQTLDPISIADTISDGIACKIYNRLMHLKNDEKGMPRPVPDLAESYDISADHRTYTFKLRKGVRFHNGREMKAADAVYSLKRLMSPMSKRADLMFPFVKGSEAYYKANTTDEVMHDDPNLGIRALDEYTLQIELAEPFAPFLQHLSTSSCAIVPHEAAERKDGLHLARAPVGTGPFMLDPNDWIGNQQLLLKRFDNYFGGKPKLSAIKFLIFKDRTLPLKLFMAGQLDAAVIPNGHVKTACADVGGDNVLTYKTMRTNYVGIGMPNGKFKNKADLSPYGTNKLLRQALSHALDRKYLCEKILEDRAIPSIGVLPPGMPGCKEDRPPMKRDLAKARELLAAAGYPGGKSLPPITMLIRNDEDTKNIAQAIAHDFGEIGVDVRLQPREWNRFLEETENEPQPMFLLGWVADYPDPDNFLYVLFNSKQFGSAGNYTFYANAKVDELTEQARKTVDMSERAKIYEQVEDQLLDDAPWICTVHALNKVLLRKEIKGIREHVTPLDTGTEFPQVEFAEVEISLTAADEKAATLDSKLGQNVAVTGVAESAKLGAILQTAQGSIYIDGLSAWPEGFTGQTVSAAGILAERFDLPVYIAREGEPAHEGIPVKEGADLKAASRRLLIKLTKMEMVTVR